MEYCHVVPPPRMPSARGGRDTRAERVSGALASAQGDELHHEMGVSSHVYLGITEHALAPVREGEGAVGDRVPS